MNRFHIRPASSADLTKICDIEENSFSAPYPRFLLRRLIHEQATSFTVAVQDSGKILGYCVFSLDGKASHLISIAVHTNYRRMGIATALMENLIVQASSHGVREVWLEVKTDNEAAIALYVELGFLKSTIMENYYSDGSPALRMQLALSSQRTTVPRMRSP